MRASGLGLSRCHLWTRDVRGLTVHVDWPADDAGHAAAIAPHLVTVAGEVAGLAALVAAQVGVEAPSAPVVTATAAASSRAGPGERDTHSSATQCSEKENNIFSARHHARKIPGGLTPWRPPTQEQMCCQKYHQEILPWGRNVTPSIWRVVPMEVCKLFGANSGWRTNLKWHLLPVTDGKTKSALRPGNFYLRSIKFSCGQFCVFPMPIHNKCKTRWIASQPHFNQRTIPKSTNDGIEISVRRVGHMKLECETEKCATHLLFESIFQFCFWTIYS